jgi:hypothetical protein
MKICSYSTILDGIKFYRSENNVILSPGDSEGFIKPKYFVKVVDLVKSKNLAIILFQNVTT